MARLRTLCVLVVVAVAVLSIRVGEAQSVATADGSARDLTVQLLTAHPSPRVTVNSASGKIMLRTCVRCAAVAVTTPLEVTASGTKLSAAGRTAAELRVDGALRLSAASVTPFTAAGHWRFAANNGTVDVRLTLPSEVYVAAALAGEASPLEPPASLRALAIVVRTFALANAGRHAAQGFDLCDSTHCQALSFAKIRPEVLEAVADTAGETLWFGPKQAQVFFSQNCGGHTEAARDAWPKLDAQYLRGVADPYCVRSGAAEWNARLTLDQIADALRRNGIPLTGRLKSVSAGERSLDGRLRTVRVNSSTGETAVAAERFRDSVNRSYGFNQLRSDWYEIQVDGAGLMFHGRGFGHGVGLCQAGAAEMAREGQDHHAILRFYFPSTRPGIGQPDAVWHKADAGSGISLLTSTAADEAYLLPTVRQGAQKAAVLVPLPSAESVRTVVQTFPSTELFRENTGAPGWDEAVTSGYRVSLQPTAVLRRHGGVEETVLHELLHVRIEHLARPDTPLWLREGLAGALAAEAARSEDASAAAATLSASGTSSLDTALAAPSNEQAARKAHSAAETLARRALARYGTQNVLEWLHNGIPPGVLATLRAAERR